MITNKELQAITLSPTKADFYQLWNELMETANKLSERWKPSETNESDPGVVLLKVLCGTADKLNYTIAKNILESFMPSAAQEESMRKLCSMLGYDMKYYQSATTTVKISYTNTESTIAAKLTAAGKTDTTISIPAFTNIKNADADINYFTLEPKNLDDSTQKTIEVEVMEGEVCLCGDDTNNIITVAQLDDNNRYYLPESQIAENGIFITNITNGLESQFWDRVTNLNTQSVGTNCFKFGFDSMLQMPYVQFPDDISNIIKDGLIVRYTRTNGINGNISYNTLSTLELPETLSTIFTSTDFAVKNASATANGRNKETIDAAYNNYKKTIGTFDTLVTCRDYINKIYQLTTDDANTTPLVSNDIVSDIRDDINRAITLCTFNHYGIAYVDQALLEENSNKKIENFDLVLYPFTSIKGTVTKDAYNNSFKYSTETKSEIEQGLSAYKTLAHNLVYPKGDEIVAIKNYLKLKAKITTTTKVNTIEEALILTNIYNAIYEAFNARNIDFGEEIPFDSILKVIETADTRIKNVALEEPILVTKFCNANGEEDFAGAAYNKIYNKLALRNILAGRIPLFDYDEDFKPEFNETAYGGNIQPVYPVPTDTRQITRLDSEFQIKQHSLGTDEYLLLNENEVLQFRSPNFKTKITYPAYVNYFLYLGNTTGTSKPIPKNADYKLDKNEWLAINYTPSTTADDGTTSTGSPINIVYKAGDIIRPNFELYDSIYWKSQHHSPSKTSGYDDMPQEQKTIINPVGGMYTFSTNEQVEIRDIVKIVLDEQATNIYWERNDEDSLPASGDKIYFRWEEENELSYTLKEGEYIYYTDDSKIDLAYYGNGTKITRANSAFELYKIKKDSSSLADQIANEGLLAALPWVAFDCSKNNITLTEYQYINLTTGDKLYKLNFGEAASTYAIDAINGADKWTKIVNNSELVSWKYSTDGSNDPKHTLPGIIMSSDEAKWHARTILNIDASPTKAQNLRLTKKSDGNAQSADILTVVYDSGNNAELSQPDTESTPVSVKTNYTVQSSTGTTGRLKNAKGENITDFKLATFAEDTSNNYTKISSYLGNFGSNNWTKITFAASTLESFDLNINLHSGDHALIMFYDLVTGDEATAHPSIKLSTGNPKICNAAGSLFTDDWWTNYHTGDKYYLRGGVNIVEVSNSCTLTVYANTAKNSTLIFSNFDAVKYENSNFVINPRLEYKADDIGTPIGQALKNLRTIDTDYQFYYNTPIDSSVAIDLNTNITDKDDSAYESLATPATWYDYNNINNKFVISEIDAEYLKDGITLTSSSRK